MDEIKAETPTASEREDMPASHFLINEDGEHKFPVQDCADVMKAVHAWGRYKGSVTFEQFKARLKRRAAAIGCSGSLPDEWKAKAEPVIEAAPDAALGHAVKSMYDSYGDGQDWMWIGVSHNNVQDATGDYMPRRLIKADIKYQTDYIAEGRARSTKPLHSQTFVSDASLNGEKFSDYGSLLVNHNLSKRIGATTVRILLADDESGAAPARSLEAGWFDKALFTRYTGMYTPSGAKMSVGYSYRSAIDGEEDFPIAYTTIYAYERSVLVAMQPANPATFWLPIKSALLDDTAVSAILASLE